MKHDLFSDNLKLYEKTIRANPNLFADILSQDQIKQYGITNNEFWKKYIVNLDREITKKDFENEGLHKYLARIYFITFNGQKCYMVEKLPQQTPIDTKIIDEIANNLQKQGILVDKKSAALIDKEKGLYKFAKYTIKEE